MIKVMLFDKKQEEITMLQNYLLEIDEVEVIGCYLNPEEGFQKLKESKVDMIFTDIEMPVMFGIQLAEHVKEWDEDIAVVFTTDVMLYAIRAFQIGAFDYLVKPINRRRLRQTIERMKNSREDSRFLVYP